VSNSREKATARRRIGSPSHRELDMIDDEQIVAVCARGRSRQRVPILDPPLPTPPPEGADWIMAFRRWARGGR